jgi:hypothetical protein
MTREQRRQRDRKPPPEPVQATLHVVEEPDRPATEEEVREQKRTDA